MKEQNPDQKPQKSFVKDGDDYIPRRIKRPPPEGYVRQPYKTCVCGRGKMKPCGALNSAGTISYKCNKCGRRNYQHMYKGVSGLAECY